MTDKKIKPKFADAALPLGFHPKDSPNGIVWHPDGRFGAGPDCLRGTVHMSIGGIAAELTIDAAQKFSDQLIAAIKCARDSPSSAGPNGEPK